MTVQRPSARNLPSIVGIANQLDQGTATVQDTLARAIRRYEALSREGLAPFVELHTAPIVAQAQMLDDELQSGRRRSPMHGVPVAMKDNIAVANTPMAAGSAAYFKVESRDSEIVRLLRAAGAVILPRAKMHELAFGATGANLHDGGVPHPFAEGRVAGGSSSGSTVAVATGVCPIAFGTDTGGSVRVPSALCGVIGYKPTRGLIPTDGVLLVSPTMDHVGIHATRVEDVQIVLQTIADPRPLSKRSHGALAILAGSTRKAQPTVHAAFDGAVGRLRSAGFRVMMLEGPNWDRIVTSCGDIVAFEMYRRFSGLLGTHFSELGPDVSVRVQQAGLVTDELYDRALRARDEIAEEMSGIFASVDAVIGPTVPIVAPSKRYSFDLDVAVRIPRNTRLYNLVGAPAITVPIGNRRLGVGLQVASAPNTDGDLLALAAQLAHIVKP